MSPPVGALIAKTKAALLSATEEDGCEVCTPMHVILKLIHDMCSIMTVLFLALGFGDSTDPFALTPGSLYDHLATSHVLEHPPRSSDNPNHAYDPLPISTVNVTFPQ